MQASTRKPNPTKNPPLGGFFVKAPSNPEGLLDLAFLVDHMLANHRIVLLELELFRGVLLVLLRGVEVAGAGRRDQADLVLLAVSHGSILRSFRRGHAGRQARLRCRSCRSCAGHGWKRAASPSGSRSGPRSGAHAGSATSGDGFCC